MAHRKSGNSPGFPQLRKYSGKQKLVVLNNYARAYPGTVVLRASTHVSPVILAQHPVRRPLPLPPLVLLIGLGLAHHGPPGCSRKEAGLSIHQRPDRWNEPGRDCVTIDPVRCVDSRNVVCLPAIAVSDVTYVDLWIQIAPCSWPGYELRLVFPIVQVEGQLTGPCAPPYSPPESGPPSHYEPEPFTRV